jgi:hypothetical protein
MLINTEGDVAVVEILLGQVHTVLSPTFEITLGQSVQTQLLRAWKSGLTTRSQVVSPKYDMGAYMTTLFEGEAHDNIESRVKQKTMLNMTFNVTIVTFWMTFFMNK